MNSKLIKASLAGAAALAVGAGGSTFAAWSDFGVAGGQDVGAGQLVLKLGSANGATSTTEEASFGNFAPGEGSDQTRFLMSQLGDAVPVANLSVSMQQLANAENGCSSNSEAVAEGASEASAATGDFTDATCSTETTAGGEFGKYAQIKIETSVPTTDGNCGHAVYSVVYDGSINGVPGHDPVALGSLSNGQGICMRSTVTLPYTAPNTTQGDASSWDWRFDLAQA